MDLNREACRLLKICWHEPLPSTGELRLTIPCKCGSWNCDPTTNPDFTSPAGRIELLQIMYARKDWPEFITHVGLRQYIGMNMATDVIHVDEWISVGYLLDDPATPGRNDRLVKAVIEFLKRKETTNDRRET